MSTLFEIKEELDDLFAKTVYKKTSDEIYWQTLTDELRHAILIDVGHQYDGDVILDVVIQEMLVLTEAFTEDKQRRSVYMNHLRYDLYRDLKDTVLITESDMTSNIIFDLFEHQVRSLRDKHVIEQDPNFESKLVESLVVHAE